MRAEAWSGVAGVARRGAAGKTREDPRASAQRTRPILVNHTNVTLGSSSTRGGGGGLRGGHSGGQIQSVAAWRGGAQRAG